MRAVRKATLLEIRLFARDPLTLVFTLALPVVVLYVLGAVFGNTPDPHMYRGFGPMDYYVPAYVGLTIASMGVVGLPVHLAGYVERGILKRFRASNIPLWSVFGGQLGVTLIASAAGAAVLLVSAVLSYEFAWPSAPLLVLAAFLLGCLCFGAVGVFLGLALPTARAAQGAGIILWFLLMMLGGAGPPLEVLTPALRTVSGVLPLRPLVMLLQDAWLGLGWNWWQAAALGGYGAGAALLAGLLLRYPPGGFLRRRRVRPAPERAGRT